MFLQGGLTDGPPKPVRATWSGEDSGNESQGSSNKRIPKRRITVVGLNADDTNQQESSKYFIFRKRRDILILVCEKSL